MVYLVLVIVIVAVLFFFVPKRAAVILSVLAGLILMLALGVFWFDVQEQKKFSKVSVGLDLNETDCPADKPLQYRLTNQTEDTVYRVHFRYSVYREGFSTPISRSYANEVTADRIIEPSSSYAGCIALPTLDEDVPQKELRFTIEHKRVWFNNPVI